MRSAESSGGGSEGFGLRKTAGLTLNRTAEALIRPLRLFAGQFSPTTFAVAATALAAAALYVVADYARELGETAQLRHEMMHVAAAQPAAQWTYSGAVMTTLAGPAAGEPPEVGVMQRGAGAFAAALALIGLTLVRRRRAAGPVGRERDPLLAALPFGTACWNASGQLVACNAQYRARLNLDASEFRPGASYPSSIKRLVSGGYVRLVNEDENSRLLEVHREDGSCLLIDERPLGDGGFVTLVTDITERRRTDELLDSIREEQRQLARRYHEEKLKAEAASRAKTNFLAHLSHDIRTPLNHIIGFADMMRQQTYGPLGDKRYHGYVDGMKESGERLLQFFASILELAELESGSKPLRAEPFSVDDMMVAVARRFSGQAKRAGITLSLAAACGAHLSGDRFALERMAGNIVENAIRFTRAGGKVSIAAYAAPDGVVLEITDTGVGISPERLAALSQPFAFGDAALTRQHGGAGLGVAIARAIAELSGGHLAIDSRLALGTSVAISLPLPAAQEARQAA